MLKWERWGSRETRSGFPFRSFFACCHVERRLWEAKHLVFLIPFCQKQKKELHFKCVSHSRFPIKIIIAWVIPNPPVLTALCPSLHRSGTAALHAIVCILSPAGGSGTRLCAWRGWIVFLPKSHRHNLFGSNIQAKKNQAPAGQYFHYFAVVDILASALRCATTNNHFSNLTFPPYFPGLEDLNVKKATSIVPPVPHRPLH